MKQITMKDGHMHLLGIAKVLVLCVAFIPQIFAVETYRVDSAHSTIVWDGASTLHDFTGTAAVVEGVFCLEKNSSAGYVIADALSLASGEEKRDQKMHHEFMETDTFKAITFTLRRYVVDVDDADSGTAYGTWTMHGASKEIRIPLHMVEVDGVKHLKSDFPIKFTDWGITQPRVVIITMHPVVTIHIDLALQRDDAAQIPNQPARNLTSITLPDATAVVHDLGTEIKSTIVIYHDYDGVRTGISWGKRLKEYAPEGARIIPILDGRKVRETGRDRLAARIAKQNAKDGSTVLLDWNGAVAQKIFTVQDNVNIIVFDSDGSIVGSVIGKPKAGLIQEVFEYAGLTATKPITKMQIIKKGSRRRR